MAYEHIVLAANDQDLLHRIAACAASEGYDGDPHGWAAEHRWELAATPGWGDAYFSAVVTHIDRPGLYDNVIGDAMILSAVQPMLTP
jgi:hypothetical protein